MRRGHVSAAVLAMAVGGLSTIGPAQAAMFELGGMGSMSIPLSDPSLSHLSTERSKNYLLIGNGSVNDFQGQPGIGQAVDMNNFELGANKAPVPSTSGFGTNAGGPGLAGNTQNLPAGALPVASGIGGGGNIAITNGDGEFNLQDVGVYGDIGIRCAQPKSDCDAGTSNAFFNDPNEFPNTWPGGTTDGSDSVGVNPGSADQTTRIDAPNQAGVTGGFNFAPLIAEVFEGNKSVASIVGSLASTFTWNVGNGGTVQNDVTFDLTTSGLHVIDIDPGDNDFNLNGINFLVEGVTDAFAIFRLDQNMLTSNSNVLAGTGMGLNNILFLNSKQDNNQHFNFSNGIFNGVAFWSTAQKGGEINIDNAQGCTQLVADKITLNDVRFDRCAFHAPVAPIPVPASLPLMLLALGGAGAYRLMQRRRA